MSIHFFSKEYSDPICALTYHDLKNPIERQKKRISIRIKVVLYFFAILYTVLIVRIGYISFMGNTDFNYVKHNIPNIVRDNIYDRNNKILVTNLKVSHLILDPSRVIDPYEMFDNLVALFPDIEQEKLQALLSNPNKKYHVLKRNITPQKQQEIHNLGMPGLYFEENIMRYHPHNNLLAHIIGVTDQDQTGLSGIEKYYDSQTSKAEAKKEIYLSIDLRIQNSLHTHIQKAVERFNAIGGAGIVMNVNNGEILGMVSLPDFNPNIPLQENTTHLFNRATMGAYEMGSTFKIFNTAIGYETHSVHPKDKFDVSKVYYVHRHSVRDFHPIRRKITAAEILQKSSNIGSAHIADRFGPWIQKLYLHHLGLLKRPTVELPENSPPILPSRWKKTQMVTISYGHGLAVTPLQMVSAIATTINGGRYITPTFIRQASNTPLGDFNLTKNYHDQINQLRSLWLQKASDYYQRASDILGDFKEPMTGDRIFSEKTSRLTRDAMRLVCQKGGTGRRANIPGYQVIGKTGTAEKHHQDKKGYNRSSIISSFIGAFPHQKPEYAIYVMIDEPKPNPEYGTTATGGIVAAPAVGNIIKEIAPILGVKPKWKASEKKPSYNL